MMDAILKYNFLQNRFSFYRLEILSLRIISCERPSAGTVFPRRFQRIFS